MASHCGSKIAKRDDFHSLSWAGLGLEIRSFREIALKLGIIFENLLNFSSDWYLLNEILNDQSQNENFFKSYSKYLSPWFKISKSILSAMSLLSIPLMLINCYVMSFTRLLATKISLSKEGCKKFKNASIIASRSFWNIERLCTHNNTNSRCSSRAKRNATLLQISSLNSFCHIASL